MPPLIRNADPSPTDTPSRRGVTSRLRRGERIGRSPRGSSGGLPSWRSLPVVPPLSTSRRGTGTEPPPCFWIPRSCCPSCHRSVLSAARRSSPVSLCGSPPARNEKTPLDGRVHGDRVPKTRARIRRRIQSAGSHRMRPGSEACKTSSLQQLPADIACPGHLNGTWGRRQRGPFSVGLARYSGVSTCPPSCT